MNLAALFPGKNLPATIEVSGLTADSRKVEPGFVFAALKGVAADGRQFIPQALEKGAVAIIGHDLPDVGSAVSIEVEEPRLALATAAAPAGADAQRGVAAARGVSCVCSRPPSVIGAPGCGEVPKPSVLPGMSTSAHDPLPLCGKNRSSGSRDGSRS